MVNNNAIKDVICWAYTENPKNVFLLFWIIVISGLISIVERNPTMPAVD